MEVKGTQVVETAVNIDNISLKDCSHASNLTRSTFFFSHGQGG